ncbi:Predicted membrane protein [Alicyclobacillus vulcanalis]|uniref:Predicted membrane protein n=1 Tax=Alicyclobacillus vulcanalis TaxID=252246 RepID=A0A1N7MCT7_9BACL|nr:Predicted membrane protein [Alicyclobacillus vulcanalis]
MRKAGGGMAVAPSETKHRRGWFAWVFACAAAGYIAFMAVQSFVTDPGDVSFLAHKTGLHRHLSHTAWLVALHVHIASAFVAILAGALNFAWTRARWHLGAHRAVGYAYLAGVLGVDGTSGYLAPEATGGEVATVAFNVLNVYWLVAAFFVYWMARQRRPDAHRRWVVRSYVFLDTNLLNRGFTWLGVHALALPFPRAYAAAVCLSILLNVALGEGLARALYPCTSARRA